MQPDGQIAKSRRKTGWQSIWFPVDASNPFERSARRYNWKPAMNLLTRVVALVAAVLAALYCGFTMGVTWSEAAFIDPLIAVCFIGSVLIAVVAIRGERRASK
jgi:hypothetical protein